MATIYDAAANGDQWDKLAARHYNTCALTEQLKQSILALNRLQYAPYPAGIETGITHAIPKELSFVAHNTRKPDNLSSTMTLTSKSGANAANTKINTGSVLDDLFGFGSSSSAATSTTNQNEQANSGIAATTSLDPFAMPPSGNITATSISTGNNNNNNNKNELTSQNDFLPTANYLPPAAAVVAPVWGSSSSNNKVSDPYIKQTSSHEQPSITVPTNTQNEQTHNAINDIDHAKQNAA